MVVPAELRAILAAMSEPWDGEALHAMYAGARRRGRRCAARPPLTIADYLRGKLMVAYAPRCVNNSIVYPGMPVFLLQIIEPVGDALH